jgi:hypothetical protein
MAATNEYLSLLEKIKIEFSNPQTIEKAVTELMNSTAWYCDDKNALIVEKGFVPLIMNALHSEIFKVAYNAAFLIGLIAAPDLILNMEKENMVQELVGNIKILSEIQTPSDEKIKLLTQITSDLSYFCILTACSVKSMLYGSIPILIENLYKMIRTPQRTPNQEQLLIESLSCISAQTNSAVVRNLIAQILPQKQKELKEIVSLCNSPNVYLASFASRLIAYLLLNPESSTVLKSIKAVEYLNNFISSDYLRICEANNTFTFSVPKIRILQVLLLSTIPEVIAVFLWMLARFTINNYSLTFNKTPEPIIDVIRQELITQIHMYYHHTNKRIRELAKIILTNIGDTEFLSKFGDSECWIKSLNIPKERKKEIISKFTKEELFLHQLLNPLLSGDQPLLSVITNLGFNSGCTLEMYSSIVELRNGNEEAQKNLKEIINAVLVQEQADTSNKDVTFETEQEAKTGKPVFISYCWGNKTSVHDLHDSLSKNKINCWIDDGQMVGGSQLYQEIDDGISNCQVFIACCSNHYGSSVNCQRELLLATDRKKLIIPIIIAPCDPWPPKGQMGPLLAGKLYVDLSNDKKFIQNIEHLISAITQSLM